MSSSRKKAVSMAIMTLIRVLLDHAILAAGNATDGAILRDWSLMTMSTLTRENQWDDPKRNNGRDGQYQLAKNKRVLS